MLLDFGMYGVYDLELKVTSMRVRGCCTCAYALPIYFEYLRKTLIDITVNLKSYPPKLKGYSRLSSPVAYWFD